jgi:hypothetical protein
MSSTLAIVLAAGMTVSGIGPEKSSGETKERFYLVGKWEGMATDGRPPDLIVTAHMRGNPLHFSFAEPGRNAWTAEYQVIEEQGGCLRLESPDREEYFGIYRWDHKQLLLCLRPKDKGVRPTSFRPTKGQVLLILHSGKPGK